MPLSLYIFFAGNCADAIAYYQKTLGAELLYRINFGEMLKLVQDGEDGCPSGMKFPDVATAHANLHVTGSDIMVGDNALNGNAHYSSFMLVLNTQNVDEGKRWPDNLAANGKIEMDWQETFWAHGFGKVSNQYDVSWMTNVVKQQQSPTE